MSTKSTAGTPTDRANRAEKATSSYLNEAAGRVEKREQFILTHLEGLRAHGFTEKMLAEEEKAMRAGMHQVAALEMITDALFGGRGLG